MRFSLALLALPALAAATAIPTDGTGSCSTGPVQCCNKTTTVKDAASQGLLGGLLGINIGDLTGLVGLQCSPITVIGVAGNSCSAQAVCCTNVSQNGLVNLGCTPVKLL
ncbi:fungal hydrophobin-domain-containing protein [Schizophyllum amplum]|uniref:Hydrophobin n=1 Tax=Schizophyllum amplum TaxID=97359 RepID=A0A550CMD6_9AGAR|nr:fungal hydrophobin-domain-containing protein [Auriculariopsis ampla]